MEHIIIVRVNSDRSAKELVDEIRANLEYEGLEAEAIVAPERLTEVLRDVAHEE